MTLFINSKTAEIQGTYPDFHGDLAGHLDATGGQITMTWVQPNSEERCATMRGGSPYWGEVTWRIMVDAPNQLVEGAWRYCSGQWQQGRNGRLTEGPTPYQAIAGSGLMEGEHDQSD